MKILKGVRFDVFITLLIFGSLNISAQNRGENFLEGTWEGKGTQADGQSWQIKLTVKGNHYRVEYPSLSCRGQWFLYSKDSKKTRFIERVQPGACQDMGSVYIEKLSEAQIKYSYAAYNTTKIIATGTLEKIPEPQVQQQRPDLPNPASIKPTAPAQTAASCNSISTGNPSVENQAYGAGDLLLETNLYRLHARLPEFAGDCWCQGYSAIRVALIFKAGENYRVVDSSVYRRLFEEEILPAIASKCYRSDDIAVTHHIQGFYITNSGNEVLAKEEAIKVLGQKGFRSEPLSTARRLNINRGVRERIDYSWRDGDISIAAKRERINIEIRERAEQQRLITLRPQLNREKAAGVLNLLETHASRNAPATFDFSRYSNKTELLNIYIGNFEPFTGKYEQGDLLKFISGSDLDGLLRIGRLRSPVMMAQSAYHRLFQTICSSQKETPWVVVRYQEPDIVTKNFFGSEISRVRGNTYEYSVRMPFAESFLNAHKGINEANNSGGMFVGISQTAYDTYKRDFDQFLREEGCSSPVVRQFEVNLYLATEWLLPLQVLRESHKDAIQSPQKAENQKPQAEQPLQSRKSTARPKTKKKKSETPRD